MGTFVISKVFLREIFDDAELIKAEFTDIPNNEKVYFHFYGMTLITLLSDLIIRRFGVNIIDKDIEDSNINQVRNRVFDGLLEPVAADARPKYLNYTTFKYSGDRQKRWDEVYDLFIEFLGQILIDTRSVTDKKFKNLERRRIQGTSPSDGTSLSPRS